MRHGSTCPGILAYGIVTTAFSNIAISLAYARDYGVHQAHPGHAAAVVDVHGRAHRLDRARDVAMTAADARRSASIVLDVQVHADMIPGLLLGAPARHGVRSRALGIGFVRFVPSAETAGPMQAFLVMPIAFVSNVFFPLDNAPAWLSDVAGALPLKPLADAAAHRVRPAHVGARASSATIWRSLAALDRDRRVPHDAVPAGTGAARADEHECTRRAWPHDEMPFGPRQQRGGGGCGPAARRDAVAR